ncbi:Small G protein signaling modulator 2, partial [Varanus komodoensis]
MQDSSPCPHEPLWSTRKMLRVGIQNIWSYEGLRSWGSPSLSKETLEKRNTAYLPSALLSSSGVVEACLLHMLKRRTAGFLRTDKIAALFTKVGKTYDVANDICRKAQELLQQVEDRSSVRKYETVGRSFSYSRALPPLF